MGGFQTAGKATSISVSEDAVKTAGSILGGSGSHRSNNAPQQSAMGGFQTAGKATRITASEEALGKAESLLGSSACQKSIPAPQQPSFGIGFRTVGKAKSIKVSQEALVKAGAILSSGVSQKSASSHVSAFHASGNAESMAVDEKALHGPSLQEQPVCATPNSSLQFDGDSHKRSATSPLSDYCREGKMLRLDDSTMEYTEQPFESRAAASSIGGDGDHNRVSKTPRRDGLNEPQNQVAQDFRNQHPENLYSEVVSKTPCYSRSAKSVVTMSVGFRKCAYPLNESPQLALPTEAVSPVPIHFDCQGEIDSSNHRIPLETAGIQDSLVPADVGPPKASKVTTSSHEATSNLMTTDRKQCRSDGVAEVTLEVDSTNAAELVFHASPNGSFPHSFRDHVNQLQGLIGFPSDLHVSLVERGCKKDFVNTKWLLNHKRWIVWKLASLERRFSWIHGGTLLSYENLIAKLYHRYCKEYNEGKRPVLRKILNKDTSAARMMILCVCQVFRQNAIDKNKEGPNQRKGSDSSPAAGTTYSMELTDGWYSVHAAPDGKICEYLESGRIKVGTKMMVSGACLVGADDGIDPLDDSNTPYLKQCKVFLRISANASRLAKWDAKLGFVPPCQQLRDDKGLLRVKKVSDVVPGGGFIPMISLLVCRKYPMMYLHRGDSGEEEMITEAEEHKQRVDFERRKLNLIEKFTEEVEQECTKDVDELAPPLWTRLTTSPSPEDFYHGLNNEGKSIIERWRAKRSAVLQRRIQQEVQAKIEEDESLIRHSTPFLRVLVASHDRSLLDRAGERICNEQGILTVWSPTEEQLGLFREGGLIQVENLAARQKYEGRIQLSANGRTTITACSSRTSFSPELMSLCYSERKPVSIFQIHVYSRRLLQGKARRDEGGEAPNEHDIVGVILKVVESDSDEKMSIYLTDKSSLVVRVQCGGLKGIGDSIGLRSPFARQCVEQPRVLAFRDLTVLPFDAVENCAVLEFRVMSSIRTKISEPTSANLRAWAVSTAGRSLLSRRAAFLDCGLFTLQRPKATFVPLVGYIAGFKVQPSHHLSVLVDSASGSQQEFTFPYHLLQDVVLPNSDHETVSLSSVEEGLCSKLTLLGKFFRARGVLHRFLLKRTESSAQSITSYRPCEFEVCQISAVDLEALCGVYDTSE
ncbi:cancer type 2 susceptibility protein [Seminavis robusta]|uniref:Cancer type 2 susceptibility protein n=1 Tax=Seminavis robusta TaxID=568900 RepID=A0A9N8HUH3_9STRA|nr:cancer type 2 susceptibility protein [Seminavis robusta]|eukprot:Sro1384_g268050.1 cancer type 2 susceptibility protein (1153) ;mRNA; r:1916-5481